MKTSKTMQQMWKDSYLSDGNDEYLEHLYEIYLKNPDAISPDWRSYFNNLAQDGKDVSHQDVRDYFLQLARMPAIPASTPNGNYIPKQEKIISLISSYRSLGHLLAKIDPLGLYKGIANPVLDLSYYGFGERDLDTLFDTGTFKTLKKEKASLREIFNALQKTYCGSLGIEYMHIPRLEEVSWLQHQMEEVWPFYEPSSDEKRRILDRLIVADGLEKYLGNKYVGQKRFSLEGGDSLIPMLQAIIHRGP